jgi:hypothetical protein
MMLDSNTFGSQIRNLVSDLESDNNEQAEYKIRDSINFLDSIREHRPDATSFDTHKVQATWIALLKARDAFEGDNSSLALTNAKDALRYWEQSSNP